MTATYKISSEELNQEFLEALKSTFKLGKLTITVEQESDETERILQHPEYASELLKRSEELSAGKNKVTFEGNEFLEKFGS